MNRKEEGGIQNNFREKTAQSSCLFAIINIRLREIQILKNRKKL